MNNYECGNAMDKLYTDTDIDPVYEDKLIKVTKQAINRKKIMEANVEFTALKEKLKQEYHVETIIEIDDKTYKSKDRKIGNLSMDADFLNERIQLQKILCMIKEPEKISGIDTTTCFFPTFKQNTSNEDYINVLIAAGYKLINEDHGSPNIAYNCDKYEFIRGNHE